MLVPVEQRPIRESLAEGVTVTVTGTVTKSPSGSTRPHALEAFRTHSFGFPDLVTDGGNNARCSLVMMPLPSFHAFQKLILRGKVGMALI